MPNYPAWVEISLDVGNYVETITVYMNLGVSQGQAGDSGIITPLPSRPDARVPNTMVIAVTGFVVQNGDALSPDGNGSIPLAYGGQLFVDDVTFIDEDVFEAA